MSIAQIRSNSTGTDYQQYQKAEKVVSATVSPKEEVSCGGQVEKEYKNAVKDYKTRHPQSAVHVDAQVRAGKEHIKNCSAENVSRSDMTMEEYKAFFKDLMDRIPFDSSQRYNTENWSITEEGWEQMKNDPDYEAWVLGYTVENRSVHFPYTASSICIEKFGASIDEHLGQGFPADSPETEKTGSKEESWWYKRHKKMKQLIKEQSADALSKARCVRKMQQQEYMEREMKSEWTRQRILSSSNQTVSDTGKSVGDTSGMMAKATTAYQGVLDSYGVE